MRGMWTVLCVIVGMSCCCSAHARADGDVIMISNRLLLMTARDERTRHSSWRVNLGELRHPSCVHGTKTKLNAI